MDDIIDLGALRAERAELANRIAAIDKIFHAVAALDGSVTVRAVTSTATATSARTTATGSGRQRRTNQEVDEIKAAIAAELAGTPGTKNEITQRLQAKGILTGSRRDRELVLRTLKELVDSDAATLVNDTYEAASTGATEQFDRIRGALASTDEA